VGLKPDSWIRGMVLNHQMITPFIDHQVGEGVISYGLSSYGYDIRIADHFRIFAHHPEGGIIDPKNFDVKLLREYKGEKCIIPGNSFALAVTLEYFIIPRNVTTICLGKSTYARAGIVLNVTPFESEWEGYATLEISNTSPLPAIIYANEGIGQLMFFTGDDMPEVSYRDRKGKYNMQAAAPVPPRILRSQQP
jgi:dCTP deaminase